MKRVVLSLSAIVFVLTAIGPFFSLQPAAADEPADGVVVMYFHRTQRCPTCLRMGSYSEESVKTGFAKEIENGSVRFHYVDFQAPANATLAQGYRITGPSLIVAKITNGKVAQWKNLTQIWDLNSDKDAFFKYVQDAVKSYQ